MRLYLSDRHWYLPRSDLLVVLPFDRCNHTSDVLRRPAFYGVDTAGLVPEKPDYDGTILWKTMQQGYVRIYFDRYSPSRNTSVEGIDWIGLRQSACLILDEVPDLTKLIVVHRHGPGHLEGIPYVLEVDQIDHFIRYGRTTQLLSIV